MKKKYLTSLLSTELLSICVVMWFISGFRTGYPWPTMLFLNLIGAGYMISRCIFKNNSARKHSAWFTTEWYLFLWCQSFNYATISLFNVEFIKVGGCATGILIVYLITRGITKHNVNRPIII